MYKYTVDNFIVQKFVRFFLEMDLNYCNYYYNKLEMTKQLLTDDARVGDSILSS